MLMMKTFLEVEDQSDGIVLKYIDETATEADVKSLLREGME